MKPNRNPAGSDGYPEKFKQAVLEEEKWERIDCFAAAALTGLLALPSPWGPLSVATATERAYAYAEALEQERERRRGK